MCTRDSLTWIQENLSAQEVHGKCILEVGSYDVNGSLREPIERLGPAEYIGTDMRAGPGVDLVCRGEDLEQHFDGRRFDVVLCSSTLEHVRNWQEVVSNIKRLCTPAGLILIITPSRWQFHPHPWDYWRFSPADIEHIFADCEIQTLREDQTERALVYARIRKPDGFEERDLSGYRLMSILTGKRVDRFRWSDVVSRHFLKVLAITCSHTIRLAYARFYMRWLGDHRTSPVRRSNDHR